MEVTSGIAGNSAFPAGSAVLDFGNRVYSLWTEIREMIDSAVPPAEMQPSLPVRAISAGL